MGDAHDEKTCNFTAANLPSPPACHRCGHVGQSPQTVSMAFWRGTGLLVIREIPVMACDGCRKEYLADMTILTLERMRGGNVTREQMIEAIIVPVYRYTGEAGS